MTKRKIVKHPEYTEFHSAIDGIAKERRPSGEYSYPPQNAIRSDIEKILDMNDVKFNEWYTARKEVTEKLLKPYELFASIPHLAYGSEGQQENMMAYSAVSSQVEVFKQGLEYLEIIRKVREESKK